jgi:hypothetical protein
VANKILLTDCDGVLLDWETKFRAFAKRLGYRLRDTAVNAYSTSEQYDISQAEGSALIAKFNASSDFESLTPFKDSVEYITRLKNENWKIVVITTAGDHPWTYGLRKSNLDRVFGQDAIDELHILPLHGDKGIKLVDYMDSNLHWIEDKPSNAELGFKYGLRPLIMTNNHNLSYLGPVSRVNAWNEAYKIINDTTV